MVFRQDMFQSLNDRGRREGACHKGNPDRHEGLWREALRRQPRPKAMAISGHRGETGDAAGLNKIIDLSALHIRRTVISSWENSVTGLGPRLARSLRQVLQIGAHVKSGGRRAPKLSQRLRSSQAV